jgi:hypothetical protein
MGVKISRFNAFALSVVDDIFVDNEVSVVIPSISYQEFARLVFEAAHRGKVCLRMFI